MKHDSAESNFTRSARSKWKILKPRTSILTAIIILAAIIQCSAAVINSTDSQNLSEWRMGGRFMNGSRYWNGQLNSSELNLLWNVVNNERVYTDVTVVDGRAFWVTGGDTQEKFIIADANLGNILCDITLGERGNRNSVSVLDGVAYVGFGTTNSGNFSAFNADTCELLWYYVSTPRNKFVTGNLVYNGVVYTANFNQKYYALNASTGALIWATDSGRFLGEIAGFPTLIDNGSIAYLYYNTGTSLDCLYAINGSIKWSNIFTAKATPGLIHNDHVWTCVDGTDYCYKFEYDTGTQVCNYSNADFGSLFAYPSLANDTLFLPSSLDEKLYAIDTDDCSNPYNVSLGNTLEGAGVVTQEYYYASLNDNHTVAAINIADGSVDHAFRVVPNPLSLSIANNILYVGAYVDVAAYGSNEVVASISSSSSSSSSSLLSSSSSSSSVVSTSSSQVSSSVSSSLSSSSLISSSTSSSLSSSESSLSSSSSTSSSSSENSISSSSSSSSILPSSSMESSSSSSSSSTTLYLSWMVVETVEFDDLIATTTTLRDIYEPWNATANPWTVCEEYGTLDVAAKLGCYMSVVSSEFMISIDSLSQSIIDFGQSVIDVIVALPGAIQDDLSQRWEDYFAGYGVTKTIIQSIQTYIWTLIWAGWGIVLVLAAFFIGGSFALFMLMESLFLIMAFGSKTRDPWGQMKKFVEYQMHMVYFIIKVLKKIYDLIYSVFSLIRGGGTTGT